MDPMMDVDNHKTGEQRSRRVSARGVALAVALALAVGAALALSCQLLGLVLDRTENLSSIDNSAATRRNLQFSFLDHPAESPEIHFVDGDGRPLTLGDFRGRPILLNIWATWCVPCRKEMPSLDRLQAKFDPSQFLVLTLSIDRQGVPAVRNFYQELGLRSLGIYVDQPGTVLHLLRAPGVPTTVFVDRDGRQIGRKIGPAEWDGPEAVALLRDHLNLPSDEQIPGAPK